MSVVSVVVPVHNAERHLRRCLDSLREQTYGGLQIVLVDDGSVDNSLQICRRSEEQSRNVTVISQPNSGPSSARNAGLRAATGRYVCFVDADDWVEPTMVEDLVTIATTRGSDYVMCNYRILREGQVIPGPPPYTVGGPKDIHELRVKLLTTNALNSACTKLYAMSLIESGGIEFDERLRYGEDTAFNLQYLDLASQPFFTPSCLYNYRYHRASASRTFRGYEVEMYLEQYDLKRRFLERWGLGEDSNIRRSLAALSLHDLAALLVVCARGHGIARCRSEISAVMGSQSWLEDTTGLASSDCSGLPLAYWPIAHALRKRRFLETAVIAKFVSTVF